MPNSSVGLALLVEACEALWLDEEAVVALRKLCESAPWRGELWVRLADAMLRLKAPSEEVARVLENALEPDMEPEARRRALLSLTDLDLAQHAASLEFSHHARLYATGHLRDLALGIKNERAPGSR